MIRTIAIHTAGVIALNAASLDLAILDFTATDIRAGATEIILVGIVTASTTIRTA